MKRVVAVLVMLVISITVVGNDGWPSKKGSKTHRFEIKKGFNYKKHNKKQHRTIKLNRLFNRNNCYNHNIGR